MTIFDARIIGAGRAGSALARALEERGWSVDGPLTRRDEISAAATGCTLLVIATGDGEISAVAASITPGTAVVCHLSGASGLDVLVPHARVASVHPLVAIPDGQIGAQRLVGAWFAHAGDPAARAVIDALDGTAVDVADKDRVRYHATAVIASNHITALLGQVERLAASIGVPAEAFLGLSRGAIDNVEALGAQRALTGPVARDDWATVAAHLASLDPVERPGYSAAAELARLLRDTKAEAPACA